MENQGGHGRGHKVDEQRLVVGVCWIQIYQEKQDFNGIHC